MGEQDQWGHHPGIYQEHLGVCKTNSKIAKVHEIMTDMICLQDFSSSFQLLVCSVSVLSVSQAHFTGYFIYVPR